MVDDLLHPSYNWDDGNANHRNAYANLEKAAMNRFLTKKRAKKVVEQPKAEVKLDCALPTTDSFRQSLLLPGLSARFSMLREQDDPNSLLGKASDDSVLQPKRQSRLYDYGFTHDLADIAEVSSIRSVKRPFADSTRANSFASDGYATEDDASANTSIMNRNRPIGEGNVLFGGRQKVYMVAANKSEASLGTGLGLRGRALYDEDVSTSTFQRMRAKERAERKQQEPLDPAQSPVKYNNFAKRNPYAPPMPDTLRRQASDSTTKSNPSVAARSSTATMSVASQGGGSITSSNPTTVPSQASSPSFAPSQEKNSGKGRRLYEQGLDRDIREQQSSSMTRFNSIQKQRSNGRSTPDLPLRSKTSMPHLDRRERSQGFYRRSGSPTPLPPPPTSNDIGKQWPLANTIPMEALSPSPPPGTNSFEEDRDEVLLSALQPGDRGKATAMGAFNMPQQFSEQKYLERQLTLNSSRQASPPIGATEQPRDAPSPAPSQALPQIPRVRPRALSIKDEAAVPSAFSVFQKAASQLKAPGPDVSQRKDSAQEKPVSMVSVGSEYDSDRASRATSGVYPAALKPRVASVPRSVAPPEHEHPAFRSQDGDDKLANVHPAFRKVSPPVPEPLNLAAGAEATGPQQKLAECIESPTLGKPNPVLGLSGLVRTHLRNRSLVSERSATSVYIDQPVSPLNMPSLPLGLRTTELGGLTPHLTSDVDTPAHSSYTHSNPWDLEDFNGNYNGDADSISSISREENGQQDDAPTVALDQTDDSSRSRSTVSQGNWQDEVQKSHRRDVSTETTQERLAFQNELDARRRAIQEKLKEKVESEKRSSSPNGRGPFRGLDMLRQKSSRESFKTNKSDLTPKPGKPFAIPESSSQSPGSDRDLWKTESRGGSRSNSRPPVPRSRPSHEAEPERRSGQSRDSDEQQSRSRKNSMVVKGRPASESTRPSTRSRSNSEHSTAGRSRSRNGRYRDDLEKAMAEGTSSRTNGYPEPSPAIPEHFVPQATEGASQLSPIDKLNPYFENTGLFPPPQGFSNVHNGLPTPRPSLALISPTSMSTRSSEATSPAISTRSGRVSPFPFINTADAFGPSNAVITTPPHSAGATPTMPAFPPANAIPVAAFAAAQNFRRQPAARKKSVNKSTISEPKLISTTSVIDTVDLPPGASLANGMDEVREEARKMLAAAQAQMREQQGGHLGFSVPPLPPMNPLRRRFFGKGSDSMVPSLGDAGISAPFAKEEDSVQTQSADEAAAQSAAFKPKHRLRKSSSEGAKIGLRIRAQREGQDATSPPVPGKPLKSATFHAGVTSPAAASARRRQQQMPAPPKHLEHTIRDGEQYTFM